MARAATAKAKAGTKGSTTTKQPTKQPTKAAKAAKTAKTAKAAKTAKTAKTAKATKATKASPTPSKAKAAPAKTRAPATKRDVPAKRPKAAAAKGGRKPAPEPMIFTFSKSRTDGNGSMKALLGGKGANLAEMTSIGLPVPPGFTLPTSLCERFYEAGERLPAELMPEVARAVSALERETGKRFGNAENPLLVSVRSGAAASMPGMMDTILNLGLNDEVVEGLARLTGAERFAWDAYRRLVCMFGDVVMGVEHAHFERAFDAVKRRYGAERDTDVPAEGMREVTRDYQAIYAEHVGAPFPAEPLRQLELAIEAVFKSWNTPRAVSYRRINEITGLRGTAVNVQSMVFGNLGDDSGTGVAFTRNPSNGENIFYGEFLVNAQGEDVVAGIRTPRPVSELSAWDANVDRELLGIKKTLERHYRDVQDIEFTVERGKLYMLQTRTGKRTGLAAVKIACDLVKEKVITRDEALLRVPANDLTQLLLPRFDPEAKKSAVVLAKGLPASPGVAVGKPAFTAEEAVRRAAAGESVILVREQTSPEDIDGMHSAAGVLTSTGGMTSHAAVVARGWGKCCVAGAGDIEIDVAARVLRAGGRTVDVDTVFSLDGTSGEVLEGRVPSVEPTLSDEFAMFMGWADAARKLGVHANADTPEDARRARSLGAEGIGLCRTEHMFFDPSRIPAMREMIVAETDEERERALAKLLPFQRADFVGLFREMDGLPVTIRLLDPPLHEFLPHDLPAQELLARTTGVSLERVQQRIADLREANPMLGHRGCRLAVTYPAIQRMQVRAVVEAAIESVTSGVDARPEIMVPLVGMEAELKQLRAQIVATIEEVKTAMGFEGKLAIPIGTMIEVPRAALIAGDIAKHAEFFSFGTNDLTQMTFGFSRDDINSFLPDYLKHGILERDPFQSIDVTGVGRLMGLAVAEGRKARPHLHLGICGEHGGDPASVEFCHALGLDYVSCSPFRVPVARLAAAQAAIRGA